MRSNYFKLMLALFLCALCQSTSVAEIPASRNPLSNIDINPKRNPTINPKRNPTINPKRNPTINPKRNPTINPKRNTSLDPFKNDWEGSYIFSPGASHIGVYVIANEEVRLRFLKNETWVEYLVSNGDGGFNRFDLDGEWIGYLVPNGEGNWNIFNLDGDWEGFTT